jgi:hypothetical protein
MNDAFGALVQQFALIRPQLAGVRFEVAGGQRMKFLDIRRRRHVMAQDPDKANLFAQARHGAFYGSQYLQRSRDILWLNAPKNDVRVTHHSIQLVRRMIRSKIDEQTVVRGPVLQQLFDPLRTERDAMLEQKPVRNPFLRFPAVVVACHTGRLTKLAQAAS